MKKRLFVKLVDLKSISVYMCVGVEDELIINRIRKHTNGMIQSAVEFMDYIEEERRLYDEIFRMAAFELFNLYVRGYDMLFSLYSTGFTDLMTEDEVENDSRDVVIIIYGPNSVKIKRGGEQVEGEEEM